jgi:hypothetical protein
MVARRTIFHFADQEERDDFATPTGVASIRFGLEHVSIGTPGSSTARS